MAVRRAPPGAMALLERARHCVTDRSLKTTALVVQRTVRAGDISMDSCAICMEDLLTSKPTSGSPVSNAATVSISAASCGGWRAREPPGARSAGRSSSEAPACEAGASGGGPRAAAPASAGRRADPSWGPPMGGAGRRAAIATEGAAAPWPRAEQGAWEEGGAGPPRGRDGGCSGFPGRSAGRGTCQPGFRCGGNSGLVAAATAAARHPRTGGAHVSTGLGARPLGELLLLWRFDPSWGTSGEPGVCMDVLALFVSNFKGRCSSVICSALSVTTNTGPGGSVCKAKGYRRRRRMRRTQSPSSSKLPPIQSFKGTGRLHQLPS
ncbi:unnamed protein product [Prorocentrum cordatum]|uniref:Uncharacterized protein n=1 Tax=Prorocentrum cordatum TaxID=2364126 RepID=A0ABN9VKV2_9DINO|nr:unnamed protein product [Polarella glacialis]